ncbi:hypothetical protein IFR04_001635 [Cadophora malorum]|uniref:Uncharacterized protein n=1 Tax=Cadophora malorum TaxID=108018 RepID=A0A8H7WIF9_9HELO|nr:hypothetical protein IFR04_001635 [Cadophora malorum]
MTCTKTNRRSEQSRPINRTPSAITITKTQKHGMAHGLKPGRKIPEFNCHRFQAPQFINDREISASRNKPSTDDHPKKAWLRAPRLQVWDFSAKPMEAWLNQREFRS